MSKQPVISLEEAQRILKEKGVKIRTRTVKTVQYYVKCPDQQCPHHTVDGSFKGTVINWVVLNAGAHLKGAAARKEKAKRLKEQNTLLMGGKAS